MAANLVLGRALQLLEAAGGIVRYRDAEGGWNRDRFLLPGRPDRLEDLGPVLDALLDWTLYSERPVAIANLSESRWSRHLLALEEPPKSAVAATPMAQRGVIWGAIAIYFSQPVDDVLPVLGELAELATEPLSSLGSERPEGVD
jgi:GAF domain-containing protein